MASISSRPAAGTSVALSRMRLSKTFTVAPGSYSPVWPGDSNDDIVDSSGTAIVVSTGRIRVAEAGAFAISVKAVFPPSVDATTYQLTVSDDEALPSIYDPVTPSVTREAVGAIDFTYYLDVVPDALFIELSHDSASDISVTVQVFIQQVAPAES